MEIGPHTSAGLFSGLGSRNHHPGMERSKPSAVTAATAATVLLVAVIIWAVSKRKKGMPDPPPTARMAKSPGRKAPLSVCIIGAGASGCGAAAFLRQAFSGDDLDITVLEQSASLPGGRIGQVNFSGQDYEAGASILHDVNAYAVAVARRHKLRMKHGVTKGVSAVFYNGSSAEVSVSGAWSILFLILRFGLGTLRRMAAGRDYVIEKFLHIYDLQAAGIPFTTVDALLGAAGGAALSTLTRTSFREYATTEAGPKAFRLSEDLVDVLIAGGTRTNYGQTPDTLTALAAMVSMAGTQTGRLFCVKGGNRQIVDGLLKDAQPVQVRFGVSVHNVKRVPSAGWSVDSVVYDAVIIACPMGGIGGGGVSVEGYVPPPGADAMHRTIANFVKGTLSAAFLEKLGVARPDRGIPGIVMTTREAWKRRCAFSSIGLQFGVDMTPEEGEAYKLASVGPCPAGEKRPTAVWKVFSNEPLTAATLDELFAPPEGHAGGWGCVLTAGDETLFKNVDWLAYPEYGGGAQEFAPFEIGRGLVYSCAIEKAASSVEMALIGGKNVALLVCRHFLDNGLAVAAEP